MYHFLFLNPEKMFVFSLSFKPWTAAQKNFRQQSTIDTYNLKNAKETVPNMKNAHDVRISRLQCTFLFSVSIAYRSRLIHIIK